MNIFESLEQLNVSEECFDDIVSMVEAMLNEKDSLNNISHITRVHGKPQYDYLMTDGNGIGYGTPDVPANKAAELRATAGQAKVRARENGDPSHSSKKDPSNEFPKEGGGWQGDDFKLSGTDDEKEEQREVKLFNKMKKGLRKRGKTPSEANAIANVVADKYYSKK